MDPTERKLRDALRHVENSIGNAEWLSSAGIGLVDGEPGLVVSVAPGCDEKCGSIITALDLDVPVSIRVVGPIRKRSPG